VRQGVGTVSLVYVEGKCEAAHIINGVSFGSSYADDVAIFFGNFKIYYIRHIIRALKEADARLPEIKVCG
jgi:hypothetical protein